MILRYRHKNLTSFIEEDAKTIKEHFEGSHFDENTIRDKLSLFFNFENFIILNEHMIIEHYGGGYRNINIESLHYEDLKKLKDEYISYIDSTFAPNSEKDFFKIKYNSFYNIINTQSIEIIKTKNKIQENNYTDLRKNINLFYDDQDILNLNSSDYSCRINLTDSELYDLIKIKIQLFFENEPTGITDYTINHYISAIFAIYNNEYIFKSLKEAYVYFSDINNAILYSNETSIEDNKRLIKSVEILPDNTIDCEITEEMIEQYNFMNNSFINLLNEDIFNIHPNNKKVFSLKELKQNEMNFKYIYKDKKNSLENANVLKYYLENK